MKDSIRKFRTLVKIAFGKEFLEKPDITCPAEKFGSERGGWYIVPDEVHVDSVVYSFGVGEDASFETALIERYQCTVHAFDPTPKSIEWVGRQGFDDRFVMHRYGLAGFDGDISFNPPENPDHVSYTILERPTTQVNAITVPVKKLGTIMRELGHDRIDILKMDIEGAEYQVIDDISTSGIRPHQILVEFHHRFPGVGKEKTKDAIARIRAMGYHLFYVSAKNEEFCFIREKDGGDRTGRTKRG